MSSGSIHEIKGVEMSMAIVEKCRKSMFVVVTREMIDAGMSVKGAWSRDQLEMIGVEWPPKQGWIARTLGRRLPGSTVAAFIELKDKHLAASQTPSLFESAGQIPGVCDTQPNG